VCRVKAWGRESFVCRVKVWGRELFVCNHNNKKKVKARLAVDELAVEVRGLGFRCFGAIVKGPSLTFETGWLPRAQV
jgi:hypothetical protein